MLAAIRAGATGGIEGHESRILYEFWAAGIRDERLNDADHALDRRQAAIYRRIIDDGVAAGMFEPRLDHDEAAVALVGLEDGLVMDILAGTKSSDEVVALIVSVAEAMLGARCVHPPPVLPDAAACPPDACRPPAPTCRYLAKS